VKGLCALFGKTRHALYDHQWRRSREIFTDDIILKCVKDLREQLPRLGTRKLLYKIEPLLQAHGIKVGRDYLFDLLGRHRLLIRQRKRKIITTDSRHWMHKYDNLIKDLDCHRPEQIWVSDITYMRMGNQWGYLSLITDAYSRKIMGYCLRTDMLAAGPIEALKMAINNRRYKDQPLIHHSDRGSQYCSENYVQVLKGNNISISMTQNGDPYENALAERMNGILKTEFNLYGSQYGFEQTYQTVKESIAAYNSLRPHSSCDYLTPDQAHQLKGSMKKRWKPYRKKWNDAVEKHKQIITFENSPV
jgi:transposase InsO family protein